LKYDSLDVVFSFWQSPARVLGNGLIGLVYFRYLSSGLELWVLGAELF